MTQFAKKIAQFNLERRCHGKVFSFRRFIGCFWERIIECSLGKPKRYRMLQHGVVPSPSSSARFDSNLTLAPQPNGMPVCHTNDHHLDSDLVALKISLLGDRETGKTSFLERYTGNENEPGGLQNEGLNLVDKTLSVDGARISYSIWELAGDEKSRVHLPNACKDSVAILFMFDLTSRRTLESVVNWYQQARKYNQTAIPILIGTKFDDFIQLPIDLQGIIASQARAYAKAFNATLFFSSATHNINVNKIFKFITAKLFDIPWELERNLTIGEPIIDF
ncbi:septum-promoting GTP-binding protein 1-like [Mangifera indica]|uniref:septum-promoting GTP-binding protein 1-like n=1 Tax=Mangifera indica TaxID=29780 RepID=UPI001CFC0975|nr:septum-promoting GTP-binding protein 1-like [Mangifera indica]